MGRKNVVLNKRSIMVGIRNRLAIECSYGVGDWWALLCGLLQLDFGVVFYLFSAKCGRYFCYHHKLQLDKNK